ncbi:MAG: amidohydrolase [Actinobacteria bacterium]|nr:amidohydrolase [Actinomycetota bacterium]
MRLQAVVCVQTRPAMAPRVADVAERFPELTLVIDHLGRFDPMEAASRPAFQAILGLSKHARVHLKLSGLFHLTQRAYPYVDTHRHVARAVEAFGAARVLWGSDFPNCLPEDAGYAGQLRLVREDLPDLTTAQREQILGSTASRVFGLA